MTASLVPTAFSVPRESVRRVALRSALIAMVCAVVWRGCTTLMPVNVTGAGPFTPSWVPLGVATYLLYRWGLGYAPVVYVAAVSVSAPYVHVPVASVVGIAGSVLAAVLAARMLRRGGVTVPMRRDHDFVVLVATALIAPLISAGAGTVAVTWATGTSHSLRVVLHTFYVWWTGDGIGIAVTVPLLLVLSARPQLVAVLRGRALEAVLTAAVVAAIAALAATGSPALLFVVIPAISWATVRFRYLGAVTAVAMVAIAALAATRNGSGPFAGPRVSDVQHLQAFIAAAVFVGFLAAVVVARYDRAEETNAQLECANAQLAELVALLEAKRRNAAAVHDYALQHLFAIGLTLESTSRATDPDSLTRRINDSVSVLGDTIDRLRAAIDDLQVDAVAPVAAPQLKAVT